MAFTADLLGGLAQLLATRGVGTWKDTGVYLVTDPNPIVMSAVPAAPDAVIVLSAYDVSSDPTQRHDLIGVQVRTRGTKDPRIVDALDDAVFDALQGLDDVTLSTGVRVLLAARQSSGPLGTDANGRHQRSSNYYLTAHRPSTNRF